MALLRRGMHFGSYQLGTTGRGLFDRFAHCLAVAERCGFDTLSVPDHLVQNDVGGGPASPMFEAYTLLGAAATKTTTARLMALVSPVTMRNPGLVAKCVTTLDVISDGRAMLGIGAGWDVDEHRAYGIPFADTVQRMDQLDEALTVCRLLFSQECPSFAGRHFSLDRAWHVPRPVNGMIPVLVGGSGERRTLRLAARHADACNVLGAPGEVRRKLDALDAHCHEEGREPSTITRSAFIMPPDDLHALGDVLAALAEDGIEGVVVLGSGDPARIEALGKALSDVFP